MYKPEVTFIIFYKYVCVCVVYLLGHLMMMMMEPYGIYTGMVQHMVIIAAAAAERDDCVRMFFSSL